MRILAFTPLHPEYGARQQTWESVKNAIAAYDGPVDWVVSSGDNPHDEPYDNITHQHNKARRMVLDDGYDALLSIEADMIVPEHTIQALIDADADIAYGLYVWRHRLKRWSAYSEIGLFGGYSLTLDPDRARQLWGQVVDVAGLGMGCTLIRRNVLETLKFRLYEGKPGDWLIDAYADEARAYKKTLGMELDLHSAHKEFFCDDWMLALDAGHHGFTQRAHLGVACGHVNGDGSVLWPHPAPGDLYYTERKNGVSDRS